MNNIREGLVHILSEYSLISQEKDLFSENYINNINDLDSISYISVLVSIEEYFNISLPDEALTGNALKDILLLEKLVKNNLPNRIDSDL